MFSEEKAATPATALTVLVPESAPPPPMLPIAMTIVAVLAVTVLPPLS